MAFWWGTIARRWADRANATDLARCPGGDAVPTAAGSGPVTTDGLPGLPALDPTVDSSSALGPVLMVLPRTQAVLPGMVGGC